LGFKDDEENVEGGRGRASRAVKLFKAGGVNEGGGAKLLRRQNEDEDAGGFHCKLLLSAPLTHDDQYGS
jgi:hypothetical protein